MINDLFLLRSIRRRQMARAFRSADWAQLAVAGVFLFLGLLIFVGAYFGYRESFERMMVDPLGGPLIARYVLQSGFALVFLLGVISFVVSSLGFFYRDREIEMLFGLPLEPWMVFLHRFMGATALSSWPVLLLGAPAVVALGAVLQASLSFYLAGLIVLALFALFIAIIGGILSFLLAGLASRVRTGFIWLAETGLSIFLVVWLIQRILPRRIFLLFQVNDAAQAASAGEKLAATFSLLPSHLFGDLIGLALPYSGTPMTATAISIKLMAMMLVAFAILLVLAAYAYLPIWRLHQEDVFAARPEDAADFAPQNPFPRVFKSRHSYLFEMEFLRLARNAEALARAAFILFLLFMYLMVVGGLSRLDEFVTAENFSRLMAFAFAVIGYFCLTLCLRFVFPSLSMEGRNAWIIWSSPLHLHELYSWKLFFWVVAVTLPMGVAAAVTAGLFGLPFWLWVFLALAVFLASLALVSITLGLGFLFPDFRGSSPDSLATSPAGLGSVAVGLVYLWIAGRYVQTFTMSWMESQQPDFNAVFGLLIVTVAVVAVFWVLAPRRLERLEIA